MVAERYWKDLLSLVLFLVDILTFCLFARSSFRSRLVTCRGHSKRTGNIDFRYPSRLSQRNAWVFSTERVQAGVKLRDHPELKPRLLTASAKRQRRQQRRRQDVWYFTRRRRRTAALQHRVQLAGRVDAALPNNSSCFNAPLTFLCSL